MPNSYRFGAVEVRPVERQVLIEGRPVGVGSRAFDVLMALIENRSRVVGKNELLDTVWPGLVVEENNLQAQISALRKLLGPRAFATIPGYGYRLALVLDDEAPGPSGPQQVVAPQANPSIASTDLIGRDSDLQEVSRLIEHHRLVTVLGAGGIGKTRLAQAVAQSLGSRYPQGVWWVDLAALNCADKVAPAIASAASVQLGDGDAVALLARAVADRAMLLVLDSCEHLAQDVSRIATALLRAAPALRILATSQEVLQAPGERVYRLDALAVPVPGAALEKARLFGAVRLLEERARASDRSFSLSEDTIAGAIELCRHLDGIPLAIEMAAARLPMLGIEGMNARLGQRLRMLRGADRDAPARHQTLRATLEWSHSLLDEREQATLRHLAVFCGTFRLEMAQLVAAVDGIDEWSALDMLMALVDKSLLQVELSASPRYRLLESTRLYALERLSERGEMEVSLRRHGQAMAVLGAELTRNYLAASGGPPVASYQADYEDLHAAFDRAAQRGDAEFAAVAIRPLTILDFERDVYSNVRRRKEAAVALLGVASPLAKGYLLNALAFFRLILIEGRTRLSLAQERVAAWRALGDKIQLYIALSRLGADHAVSGDLEACDTALEEARLLEDPRWAPPTRWFYAFAAKSASQYRGDPDDFARCSRAMLEVSMEWKSQVRIAEARICCAEAALLSGEVEEAIRLTEALIGELRELGQPTNFINALTNMAAAKTACGDLDSARGAALEAIRSPWQLETAVSLFDQIARLAARRGFFSQAGLILGFADRGYAVTQDARHTLAVRTEREAGSLIESALGAAEHVRLRAQGAGMEEALAEALAKEVLEVSP